MNLPTGIRKMLNAISRHFSNDRELDRQIVRLTEASTDLEKAKKALDKEIARERDEFREFAEGARRARF